MVFGNEGDDWIEGGMADGSAGDNFDVRGLDTISRPRRLHRQHYYRQNGR